MSPTGFRTWAYRGAQSISIWIGGGQREWFTVVAAITAAREKLPFWLISAEKTHFVEESHFGDVAYHRTDHSRSGWTTDETCEQWLSWVRSRYVDRDPICVVLDSYSVHRQKATTDHTASIGIHLLFITPGMTDEFQPLDWDVFGVMK
jgi:hypothetical protein